MLLPALSKTRKLTIIKQNKKNHWFIDNPQCAAHKYLKKENSPNLDKCLVTFCKSGSHTTLQKLKLFLQLLFLQLLEA